MTTLYYRLAENTLRAAATGSDVPKLAATLRSTFEFDVAFVTAAGLVAPLVAPEGGDVVVKAVIKLAPEDDAILLDATVVSNAEAGTARRYAAAWTAEECDSTPFRNAVRGKASVQATLEIEVTHAAGTARAITSVTLVNAFFQPTDTAPDPGEDASWDWLKLRAPEANGFTHDADLKTLAVDADPAAATHIARTDNPHAVTKDQVGLGSVTNHAQLKASDLDTDATFAANSDTKIPSQKAVKTAVDLKLNIAARGANDGVAPLDSGGKVPSANLPAFASQAEAEAGSDNTKLMTPLRTAEAIAVLAGGGGGGWETGDRRTGYWLAAPSGFVLADGSTIGNEGSGADRPNADTEALFLLLWEVWLADRSANNTDIGTQLSESDGNPISTEFGPGSTGTAAGDWAANYRLALPDERLRVAVMARPGFALFNAVAVVGAKDGEALHVLTAAELPVVAGHSHALGDGVGVQSGSDYSVLDPSAGPVSTTTSDGGFGGDVGHNTIQPSLCVNVAIKL